MEELPILLTPNKEHNKEFLEMPVVGFGVAGASRITRLEQNSPNLRI